MQLITCVWVPHPQQLFPTSWVKSEMTVHSAAVTNNINSRTGSLPHNSSILRTTTTTTTLLLLPGLWSRSRPSRSRDGLETYQRLVSVSSRQKISTSRSRLGLRRLTSRSHHGLGHWRLVPETYFPPNLQVTILKLIKSVVAVNESLADLV